jgi:alkanesulfonate monooxygenase SsuD/methylene tetrahydromethanopterin reductase-like flavin-dependent oxidoreductase (luciferase family)
VDGRVRKISIVPKPYQKPHPPLFRAFSASDATILWAARNGVIPLTAIPKVPDIRRIAELYRAELAAQGRDVALGAAFGVMHSFYFARDEDEAIKLAYQGTAGNTLKLFHTHFGFAEAMRTPEDDEKYPPGKALLPPSEITPERIKKSGMAFAGSVSDVLRGMDDLAENVNPEYLIYGPDQGLVPLDVVKNQLRTFGEQIIPRYR